ncbi:uncharacterized protein LOC119316490 isoform X2 [Triticum dicoccoides]|uniref:uncharacterized protein LOC119316490 isoform X2 n=1 Tax=Triticum dicoccoides TaxID=85692 RepID=UPI001890D00C|nr:uncharacterized protein LOC119316490 isoform X2 [Triticum dicoccoides]
MRVALDAPEPRFRRYPCLCHHLKLPPPRNAIDFLRYDVFSNDFGHRVLPCTNTSSFRRRTAPSISSVATSSRTILGTLGHHEHGDIDPWSIPLAVCHHGQRGAPWMYFVSHVPGSAAVLPLMDERGGVAGYSLQQQRWRRQRHHPHRTITCGAAAVSSSLSHFLRQHQQRGGSFPRRPWRLATPPGDVPRWDHSLSFALQFHALIHILYSACNLFVDMPRQGSYCCKINSSVSCDAEKSSSMDEQIPRCGSDDEP